MFFELNNFQYYFDFLGNKWFQFVFFKYVPAADAVFRNILCSQFHEVLAFSSTGNKITFSFLKHKNLLKFSLIRVTSDVLELPFSEREFYINS